MYDKQNTPSSETKAEHRASSYAVHGEIVDLHPDEVGDHHAPKLGKNHNILITKTSMGGWVIVSGCAAAGELVRPEPGPAAPPTVRAAADA